MKRAIVILMLLAAGCADSRVRIEPAFQLDCDQDFARLKVCEDDMRLYIMREFWTQAVLKSYE